MSGVGGTGRKVSKQFETAGMRVIDVRAGDVILDKRCEVNGDKQKHPMTTKYLRDYFGCELVEDSMTIKEADLVILVGKRY